MIQSAQSLAVLKPMLNSDRIKHLFGSYNVEIIPLASAAFPGCRISNLHSIHENKGHSIKIMRTLAIVDFVAKMHPLLYPAHKAIMTGASIGTALVAAGWKVNKNPIFFGEVNLSKQVMEWMQEKEPRAAVHIYQLEVVSKTQLEPLPYCTIIEIHSPQYLIFPSLKALYDVEYTYSYKRNERIDILLGSVEKLFAEIDLLLRPTPDPYTPLFAAYPLPSGDLSQNRVAIKASPERVVEAKLAASL